MKKEKLVKNDKKETNIKKPKKVDSTKKENIFKRIKKYFVGVGKEVKRVRWTKGDELVKYSFSTIIIVLIFGIYFYAIDWISLLVRSLAK